MARPRPTKTILITGSGSGLGRETAITLARRGHRLVATTYLAEQAEGLRSQAAAENLDLETFKLDITVPEDRERVTGYELDVLINNAAVGEAGCLAEVPLSRIRSSFEVNLFSTIAVTQLAIRGMIARQRGTIIMISSLAGRVVVPFLGPYSMTKFAISAAADALREEMRQLGKGVTVAVVEPGHNTTGFVEAAVNTKYEWMGRDSYFHDQIDYMKRQERKVFRRLEVASSDSVIRQIVRAAEARRPRLRYVAPWWQGALVRVARALGK